jgi:hypothetical protein
MALEGCPRRGDRGDREPDHIGHAGSHVAVEQYPRERLTLRQGAGVILKYPE